MKILGKGKPRGGQAPSALKTLAETFLKDEAQLRTGGGKAGAERQRALGRLIARERIDRLIDRPEDFFELGLWAAFGMYSDWGEVPAAGVVA